MNPLGMLQCREEAAVILQRGAVTDLRSRLDLTASMFYTALGEVGDVATDDQDAVAQALQPCPQALDQVGVLRREQVHHLVRGAGRVEVHPRHAHPGQQPLR